MTKTARGVKFLGWVDSLPPRDDKKPLLTEHDILRMVLLAENSKDGQWCMFRCDDRMHAIKVADLIRKEGFSVEITARADIVYIRRK